MIEVDERQFQVAIVFNCIGGQLQSTANTQFMVDDEVVGLVQAVNLNIDVEKEFYVDMSLRMINPENLNLTDEEKNKLYKVVSLLESVGIHVNARDIDVEDFSEQA